MPVAKVEKCFFEMVQTHTKVERQNISGKRIVDSKAFRHKYIQKGTVNFEMVECVDNY